MKILLVSFLLAVFGLTATVKAADKPSEEKTLPANSKNIVLEERNTLAFRGVVTYNSIKTLQDKLFKMSNKLPKSATIYLFLDTPGGSIAAGLELISSLKAVPQEIKTITNFSASMGFQVVQASGERLILPHGTLMSHRAYGGVEGQIPGEFDVQSAYWKHKIELLDINDAKRAGMSLADYQKLVRDQYWVDGEEGVTAKFADRTVNVTCADDLTNGTETETLDTWFGPVGLVWAKCPLITSPMEIDLSGIGSVDRYSSSNNNDKNNEVAEKLNQVRNFVLSMTSDKANFVQNFILNGKYKQFLK